MPSGRGRPRRAGTASRHVHRAAGPEKQPLAGGAARAGPAGRGSGATSGRPRRCGRPARRLALVGGADVFTRRASRRASKIWMIAGPRITTNMAGKMKSTSGKTSLIVVLAAASSARWRRLVRSVSACTRSACAIEVPKRSVWISMATSDLMSCRPVARPGCGAPLPAAVPARISRFTSAELLAQDRADPVDLFRDPHQRLVEPESRLDADHQQIERVRQRPLHLLLPALDPAPTKTAAPRIPWPQTRRSRSDVRELVIPSTPAG